jgi:hypothetical protein
MNAQLRLWIAGVANERVHGTTREQVAVRWDVEQFSLHSIVGRPSYPYVDGKLRKVARDAYIDWQGSRYSVPWQYVGKEVWVREMAGEVDVLDGRARIAVHARARRKHEVVTFPQHHQGIPLGPSDCTRGWRPGTESLTSSIRESIGASLEETAELRRFSGRAVEL